MKSVKSCGKASVMLTPKEISYILLALKFADEMKDVDAEELVFQIHLLAKLGSHLAIATLTKE
jgi:hypothetical protein